MRSCEFCLEARPSTGTIVIPPSTSGFAAPTPKPFTVVTAEPPRLAICRVCLFSLRRTAADPLVSRRNRTSYSHVAASYAPTR